MGEINGRVIDTNTHLPLVGANIQIVDYGIGSATDSDGFFSIANIPIGTTHIEITMIGYEKRILLNLPITAVRPLNLKIELNVDPVALDMIEVTGNMFSKSAESIISSVNINQLEFRSDPGSAWDVQRVVQSSPSVSQVGDLVNEIIVRGGSPGENLFVMDNIEIQNPNHFGIEGNGGGGFSIINPLFVKNVEFTPGAYPVRFGDKASSSMNITLKEGSRSNFELDCDISMAGAGLKVESPLNGGRGSLIAGSLWSFLENIVTNVGMTSIPYFNNHQLKVVYDLSPNTTIITNGLYANNKIDMKADKINESIYGVSSADHNSEMFIGGVTLKSFFGNWGYGLSSISYLKQNVVQRVFDYGLDTYPWFTRNNSIGELNLKTDLFLQTNIGEINTGFSFKRINYDHNEWLNAKIIFKYDTTYWDDDKWNFPVGISEPDEISPLFYRPTQLHDIYSNYEKYAAHIQQKAKIGYNWQLVTGLRLDYFSGTKETVISPRLNLKYTFNPSNAIHIAYGRHYQYPEYFMVLKSEFNQNLETEYTDQFIVGYEHFFANDFRATIELYHKYYNNVYTHYYWSHEPETYPEQLYHILDWDNNGNRENRGLELLLHKKLSHNWHGILSYSNSTSRAKDVRNIKQVPEIDTFQDDGKWYPWDYDIHHKLTLIGGWKKKMSSYYWYKQLKSNNFFRILSPILPIADEIELSFRYSYTSGKPYTSRNYYPELFEWKYPDDANWNSSRFPDYKRLDLMFLKRHNYDKLNLVLYLNFINIFNRNNVLDWIYNQNGTKETVWHFKTLPIGGITIEL